jgi:hypothetical protein
MKFIYNAASVSVQKIPSQIEIGGKQVNVAVESTVVQLPPTENVAENSVIKLTLPGVDDFFKQGKQYEVTFKEV